MNITIKQVIDLIEEALPLRLQESWDNSGLQVGRTDLVCRGVLTTLDVTEAILEEAIRKGCNLIVAHHPLLFKPLKQLGNTSYIERCVVMAVKHDITIYAAHTNADVACQGLNYLIGEKVGLKNIHTLSPTSNYQAEGLGVIGELPKPLSLADCLKYVESIFQTRQLRHNGYLPNEGLVRRIAICGGAGSFLWTQAKELGADLLITGEAKYNDYYDAEGINLVTVGHYESEIFARELFECIIARQFPAIVYRTETEHNPVITLI